MPSGKVISRVKGGLGNQLFGYAAARRLAWANDAELVVDHVTGFLRDRKYRRRYLLHRFAIPARLATSAERLEPFERARRGLRKRLARRRPFEERSYIEQQGPDFEPRLLNVKVRGTVYIDGIWLSDRYFADAEALIRADLRIIPPADAVNVAMSERIRACNAVAVHVRWFDAPGATTVLNVTADYYQQAVATMERSVETPRYFVFSDHPREAAAMLKVPAERVTLVAHNQGDDNAFADLWLMTLCRHFITANSSFSWWGAWLAPSEGKIIIAPDLARRFDDVPDSRELIPDGWIRV